MDGQRVDSRSGAGFCDKIEVARRTSPPFSAIATQTLKPSQNLYTELVLRTIYKELPLQGRCIDWPTDEVAGLQAIQDFLRQAGIAEREIALNDGSGLS